MSVSKKECTPVEVDGVEVAIIQTDMGGHKDVNWTIYGPQDASRAAAICTAILAALGDAGPRQNEPENPASRQPDLPKRNYTKAIREEIAAGLSDDEIWEKLKSELDLGSDKRYRIKEVRKEGAVKKTNEVL